MTLECEPCPFQIGDRVRLKRDPFGCYLNTFGYVTRIDVPIAKAYKVGYEHLGVIEVDFPAVGRTHQTHWSNFNRA